MRCGGTAGRACPPYHNRAATDRRHGGQGLPALPQPCGNRRRHGRALHGIRRLQPCRAFFVIFVCFLVNIDFAAQKA